MSRTIFTPRDFSYQSQTEQAFGILRFENGEIKGRGQPEKFVWLTEEQAQLFDSIILGE